MNEIKLGSTVKDLISGFTGIAIQRLEQLNGNVQIAIQPKIAEGATAYPEAMFIDHHTLAVIDEGVSANMIEPEETMIELGQRVRDRATGFEGIATQRAIYINGCTGYSVVPKMREDGLINEVPSPSWIDHNRLEVVGDGLHADVPRAVVEKDEKDAPTPTTVRPGGPAQRVMNR